MFALIIIIVLCSSMYKIAEMGNRSGFLWSLLCLALMIVAGSLIPLGFIAHFLGFVATFLIMFIANLILNPARY